MSTKHPRRQAWLSGMAKIAILGRPGNIVVVASAAKAAIDDVRHGNDVRSGAHLESQFSMTDFATKTDAMKPVGKNHRPHAAFFCLTIDNDVTIFRLNHDWHDQQLQHEQDCQAEAYEAVGANHGALSFP
jgi:hypothetical protein